jgi:hypothetical protein
VTPEPTCFQTVELQQFSEAEAVFLYHAAGDYEQYMTLGIQFCLIVGRWQGMKRSTAGSTAVQEWMHHPPGLNWSECDSILKAEGVCQYHQSSLSSTYLMYL